MPAKKIKKREQFPFRVLIGGIVAAIVLLILLIQVSSLHLRVESLEANLTVNQKKLAVYERTLCATDQSVKQPNIKTDYSINSAGEQRMFKVHVPNNYDASVRYPVIIAFDGIEGSGSRMEAYSGFDGLPIIMVYPDSLPGKKGFTSWQGAPYSADGERDIQFVRDILAQVPTQYCVDETRIFAVGMSNGGAFATIVGCQLGDKIRAVATVSGAYYTTCEQEDRTPSLLVLHSQDDQQVPFLGATTRKLPPITPWVDEQVAKRHCASDVNREKRDGVLYSTWQNCDDNSIVRYGVISKQQHGWLAVPADPAEGTKSTADYIWDFFKDSMYIN